MPLDDEGKIIVNSSICVHSSLGPGLLEGAYEVCLAYELTTRGLQVRTQVPLPVVYRDVKLDAGYRLDLVVEERIVVEVKAVARLLPVHEAQLLSYLRLGGYPVGLLINFHERHLKDGLRRFVI
jgi:GxxExxY protein